MVFDDGNQGTDTFAVAIVGLAGRFPGARNIEQFWSNLRDGVESITFASDEDILQELNSSGAVHDPSIVKASSRLTDIDQFDASFFGYSPKEADMMDPQHRLFLQCAWEALEHAGYDPDTYPGLIGMYGGVGTNMYIKDLLLAQHEGAGMDGLQLTVGNDKDYLTTRVSYKLNLRGPSIGVQTACSTSLVAVHLASQALLDYECDMALAGGVSVRAPQPKLYRYIEGSILSPDGHCRAFDARGQGTIFGNGLGLVVLKRLEDALQDGDTIYAVIKGSSINNDGSDKIGYTAPGMQGQSKAIRHALDAARVDPATLSYIETHGTGTALGDPIEFSALQHIFGSNAAPQSCALGAVKTNIGHLDVAAGIAGLIKTVLALQYKQIPPTLHFQHPNLQIDLAHSPFYINQGLIEWPDSGKHPRRAGVSSFGIGGTNAHVVLEEAPAIIRQQSGRSQHLILLSAQTPEALEEATVHMRAHLQAHPEQLLSDIAYTSQVGRHAFSQRRALVCGTHEEAIAALETPDAPPVLTGSKQLTRPFVCFLFPGQGTQYSQMAYQLYQTEAAFRETVDRCCALFARYSGTDIKALIYPREEEQAVAESQLYETRFTQPALFIIEYAMAQLVRSWGVQPATMIGHSIGEYVAACLAGVFSLEDALLLVTRRGELMQSCQPGAMLSIGLSEGQVREYLTDTLSLASINGPNLTVVSGPEDDIEALQSRLIRHGVQCHKLHTSHAFHSWMMDEITERFTGEVHKVKLNPPELPFISNVTGTWIQPDEATRPDYWARQLRSTVRFQSGLEELLSRPEVVMIEIGPCQTLNKIVRQQPAATRETLVVPTMREKHGQQADSAFLLTALARLWLAGLPIAWQQLYYHEKRQRVALPTYPFARESHWLKVPASKTTPKPAPNETALALPLWQQALALPAQTPSPEQEPRHLLLFQDATLSDELKLADHVASARYTVTQVRPDEAFARIDDHIYAINPQSQEDYQRLVQEVQQRFPHIHAVIHMWNVQPDQPWQASTSRDIDTTHAFYSVLYLIQALSLTQQLAGLRVLCATTNLYCITGQEYPQPQKALLLGPARVATLEHPDLHCQVLDFIYPTSAGQRQTMRNQLLYELQSTEKETIVAYRGQHRWLQTFRPISSQQLAGTDSTATLRQRGTYLITGGLGGLGLGLAEQLAQHYHAQLVLLTRTPFLEASEWEDWLAEHPADDRTSQRIRQLQRIKELGAEALILVADVSDRAQMQHSVEQAEHRFGPIHGVLHLAGVPGSGLMQLKNVTMADAVLAPKVSGTLHLAQALEGRKLDFVVLFSSFTAITGGIGQVDYIAANTFLEAFAQACTQQPDGLSDTRVIAIDWDAWQWDSWQSAELHIMPELQRQLRQMRTEKGITFPQGFSLLQEILRLPCSQVVVTTQDIPEAINNHRQFAHNFWTQRLAHTNAERRATPSSTSTYVAPRNEVEQTLSTLWQEALGIEQISIHDHFIELGGHSLMAVQLLWKIRETFQTNLPMNVLFEQDTISGLAAEIMKRTTPQYDLDQLEHLLQEIEGLSEEEVELLLLEEEQGK